MSESVLFVCTGNVIRSPLAAGILQARLTERGVACEVASAGLLLEGRSADPHAVRVGAEVGCDLSAHRARRISPEVLAAADLVVGMSRTHVREAAALEPSVWPRTFTLRELDRRAAHHGPRPAHVSLASWCERLSEGRSTADLLADDSRDDIADPIGADLRTFRRTAAEIGEIVDRLVSLLWPADSSAV